MNLTNFSRVCCASGMARTRSRRFHVSNSCRKYTKEFENPLTRTLRILSETGTYMSQQALSDLFPSHVDVCIVGGGAVGCAIAYFLKEKSGREGLKVVVVEKDSTVSGTHR